MTLRPDWKRILRRAWSVRLIVLAALLSGLEVMLPLMDGFLGLPRGVFTALSGLATAGALVARVVAQSNMREGGNGA